MEKIILREIADARGLPYYDLSDFVYMYCPIEFYTYSYALLEDYGYKHYDFDSKPGTLHIGLFYSASEEYFETLSRLGLNKYDTPAYLNYSETETILM